MNVKFWPLRFHSFYEVPMGMKCLYCGRTYGMDIRHTQAIPTPQVLGEDIVHCTSLKSPISIKNWWVSAILMQPVSLLGKEPEEFDPWDNVIYTSGHNKENR